MLEVGTILIMKNCIIRYFPLFHTELCWKYCYDLLRFFFIGGQYTRDAIKLCEYSILKEFMLIVQKG